MAHRESGVCIALVLGIIVTTRSGGRGGGSVVVVYTVKGPRNCTPRTEKSGVLHKSQAHASTTKSSSVVP